MFGLVWQSVILCCWSWLSTIFEGCFFPTKRAFIRQKPKSKSCPSEFWFPPFLTLTFSEDFCWVLSSSFCVFIWRKILRKREKQVCFNYMQFLLFIHVFYQKKLFFFFLTVDLLWSMTNWIWYTRIRAVFVFENKLVSSFNQKHEMLKILKLIGL